MTRLIEILIALAMVAALFLVVGILLPSSRHLEAEVETNRKMQIVYDTISGTRRFDDWNPVVLQDPAMRTETTGPEQGEGATFNYVSSEPKVGTGKWEIVEAVPGERVVYRLENPLRGQDKTMTFTLEPTGRNNRNVKITQTYDVDYGWDILGRYQGLYVPRSVGDSMKFGLQRLSNMLATVPNFDYSILPVEPALVELPAENMLVVEATVERNNDVLRRQMNANMEWIRRTMDANNLEAAGPVRIITTEFGSENYTFDVAQPVRRKGTGPAATDAAEDDSDEGADADADATGGEDEDAADETPTPIVAIRGPDAAQIEVKVSGDGNPTVYRHVEARRVVVTAHRGHMAGLPAVRDALRAWALTQGLETQDRPFEVWKSGIAGGFEADGQFDVYWPVK
ncbi:SRPBCC family protein [Luteimonas pelagia]